MSLRITTLIENSAGEDSSLEHEHGISFFIEKDGHRVLFDTGQSGAFVKNAARLGRDLSALELVALSHGHYDHTGGFLRLLNTARSFELCLKECIFHKKYVHEEGNYTFKGNPFDEQFLQEQGIAYDPVKEDCTELLPGLYVLTNFPRLYPDEVPSARFVLEMEEGYRPDRFDDEILLAIDTPRGLVVLLGCSHPGVRNMLDHVKGQLQRPLYAVLGGTHLKEADQPRRAATVEYLIKEVHGPIGVS
ncbi:MAG: MBL fold metallo-hydrolase, partial [Spirochaetia bacterium]|nr:MBL fold metallo-hydrolase [Spirochaetia bacterium]